ncbi:MAG: hypothetical protein IRZ16_19675 [Myxococcaceae bacterium]|nr:hypothetical protein [Myxococcaceae bacterium]
MEATPLDKVLKLRPTNVVMRLGVQSRLPVLNPRDLIASFEGRSALLLCVPAFSGAAIPGILRASRDEDAVVGIACPHPLGARDTPARFVEALRDAAEEVRHRKPLFLQAGPFRLVSSDPRTREQLTSAVYKYVDAGFTLVSLDASRLPVDEAVAAYRELAPAAIERELSIEITAPLDEVHRLDVAALRATLERLQKTRVQPQFVRVPGRAYALEEHPREVWQLDMAVLKEARDVVRGYGGWLSLEDEGLAPDQLAPAWLEGGARKVDPVEASARIVLGSWSEALREQLRELARTRGLHPRDLIASLDPADQDAKVKLKAEALSWSMTVDTMPPAGLRGTASAAIAHLSFGGGY